MMAPIHLPGELLVTLERFHQEQNGTISLRTLQSQAQRGALPGAYKIGKRWWINKLAMIEGLQSSGEEHAEEADYPPPPARNLRPLA